MRTFDRFLAGCLLLCGVLGATVLGKTEPGGQTFKLEPQPLPGKGASGLSWYGFGVKTLKDDIPPGVEGVEARVTNPRIRPGRAVHQVIVTRSAKDKPRFDRLYVDANADGRLGKDECYDITKSNGPVEAKTFGRDAARAYLRPVKLVARDGDGESVRWIALKVDQYGRGECGIYVANVTCTAGNVRFGDKETRLALFSRSFGPQQDFAQPIELPGQHTRKDRRYVRTGVQVFFDANGNGEFDHLRPYATGPENQWLARLLRVRGAYYALNVSSDGRSIQIAPAKPEVGRLAIPEDVESLTVLGPEIARSASSKDKVIELPVGRYVVGQYTYKRKTGTLEAYDRQAEAVLEIRPGQTTTIEVGPPLRMAVTYGWGGRTGRSRDDARTLRLTLRMTDRAGRPISAVNNAKHQRPDPPRFKIIDQKGKTLLDDAFKYG